MDGIADSPEVHALPDELTTTVGRENLYPRYELRRESLPSARAFCAGSLRPSEPPTVRWW